MSICKVKTNETYYDLNFYNLLNSFISMDLVQKKILAPHNSSPKSAMLCIYFKTTKEINQND